MMYTVAVRLLIAYIPRVANFGYNATSKLQSACLSSLSFVRSVLDPKDAPPCDLTT